MLLSLRKDGLTSWFKEVRVFKDLAHKQFLGHPGHRSSRPGTRFLPAGYPDENVYIPWVPHTAHKLWPLATGRETPGHPVGRPPPSTRAVTGKFVYVYVPFPFLKDCEPAGLVEVSKQPHRPKVLKESPKGVFGPPGRESQDSLLHGAKPLFRLFSPGEKQGLHRAKDSFGTLGPKTPNHF